MATAWNVRTLEILRGCKDQLSKETEQAKSEQSRTRVTAAIWPWYGLEAARKRRWLETIGTAKEAGKRKRWHSLGCGIYEIQPAELAAFRAAVIGSDAAKRYRAYDHMVRAKAEHRAPYDGDRRIRYRRKEV